MRPDRPRTPAELVLGFRTTETAPGAVPNDTDDHDADAPPSADWNLYSPPPSAVVSEPT